MPHRLHLSDKIEFQIELQTGRGQNRETKRTVLSKLYISFFNEKGDNRKGSSSMHDKFMFDRFTIIVKVIVMMMATMPILIFMIIIKKIKKAPTIVNQSCNYVDALMKLKLEVKFNFVGHSLKTICSSCMQYFWFYIITSFFNRALSLENAKKKV